MTLYKKIEDSWKVNPSEQAVNLLQAVTAIVTDLPEVRICKTSDGKWLYCGNDGNAIPCVTATPDYAQIEAYVATLTEQEVNGTAIKFLLRTAFESRFCFEKTVSLHAACVELGDFAVAFTGHSGVGKSTRAAAWMNAFGAQLISGDRPAVRIEKNGSIACGVP